MLETPSPERESSEVQIETPYQGNVTLTNVNVQSQESLGEGDLRPQLVESSQISNEIQVWTEIFEQKNNDGITKMREEGENKLDAILMEIKTNKSTSMVTNTRLQLNEIGSMQPSGSSCKKSMGVNASDNESLDSENEDIPLKASEMRESRHPAKPIQQNNTTLDTTVLFNEESYEDDFHNSVEQWTKNEFEKFTKITSKEDNIVYFNKIEKISATVPDSNPCFRDTQC